MRTVLGQINMSDMKPGQWRRAALALILGTAGIGLSGCSSILESRGYIIDQALMDSVQPGIDNQASVEGAMGRPTFTSEYGEPTWYYVSSITGRKPFRDPRIREHTVLAVRFDDAGRVVEVERTGMERVAFLNPNGNKTPTVGRERGFLQDLFGNIGQVGGMGGGMGPGGM
jgi:outer membrane protein assembly factor BamE (lipoprotein component of BamABCDE complex)